MAEDKAEDKAEDFSDFEIDLSVAEVPTQKSTAKEAIVDLKSALAYVQERVKGFDKDKWVKCPWIIEDKEDGKIKVKVNLFNMPLYWTSETVKNADGTEKMIQLRNADMSPYMEVAQPMPTTKLPVKDRDTAIKTIKALASGQVENLNERLEVAAKALPYVLSKELPDIEKRAAVVYRERKDGAHEKEFGKFGEPNEMNTKTGRMVISTKKQNAMNSAKQKARSDLGYARYRPTA